LEAKKQICELVCKEGFYQKYISIPDQQNEEYKIHTDCKPCFIGCSVCNGPKSTDCHPDKCLKGFAWEEEKCKSGC